MSKEVVWRCACEVYMATSASVPCGLKLGLEWLEKQRSGFTQLTTTRVTLTRLTSHDSRGIPGFHHHLLWLGCEVLLC